MAVVTVLNELGTRIQSLGLGLTLGTNFFIGNLPDMAGLSGAIYEYGGSPSEDGFNVAGIKYEHPAVQVVVRGTPNDYATPRNKLESIYRDFAAIQGLRLPPNNTLYLMVRPQQAPFPIERDSQARMKFGVNFVVDKELSL